MPGALSAVTRESAANVALQLFDHEPLLLHHGFHDIAHGYESDQPAVLEADPQALGAERPAEHGGARVLADVDEATHTDDSVAEAADVDVAGLRNLVGTGGPRT